MKKYMALDVPIFIYSLLLIVGLVAGITIDDIVHTRMFSAWFVFLIARVILSFST